MLNKRILLITMILFAVASILPVWAGHDCGSHKGKDKAAVKAHTYHVVYFSVPELTKELSTKLSKSLTNQPGLLAAKPDLEKKEFRVIFVKEKNSGKDLHTVLQAVAPKIKLVKETVADEKMIKHDCGKCPSKKKCGHGTKA